MEVRVEIDPVAEFLKGLTEPARNLAHRLQTG